MKCTCGLLWCDECNQAERARVAELELSAPSPDERQHARELARTIDQAFELELMSITEARAIACGALALLAEATGLDSAQTVATALKILGDVRAGTAAAGREAQGYGVGPDPHRRRDS
jgi:hypothetical protein